MSAWRKLESGILVPDSVAGEWDRVARYRYVACVDMLGMSHLMVDRTQLAWAALSKMDEAKKVLSNSATVDSHNIVISEHVGSFSFADTILLFTKGDDADDLRALIIVCLELFAQVLHGSIPVRIGVAHGLFVFNGDVGLFAGPAWVRAYSLGEGAQWVGAVLDKTVAARARQLKPECRSVDGLPLIVSWMVPVKTTGGIQRKRRWVLSWPRSHRRNFTVQPPVSVHDFYQAFEQFFGAFSKLKPKDRAKYRNTVEFVNAMIGDQAGAKDVPKGTYGRVGRIYTS